MLLLGFLRLRWWRALTKVLPSLALALPYAPTTKVTDDAAEPRSIPVPSNSLSVSSVGALGVGFMTWMDE